MGSFLTPHETLHGILWGQKGPQSIPCSASCGVKKDPKLFRVGFRVGSQRTPKFLWGDLLPMSLGGFNKGKYYDMEIPGPRFLDENAPNLSNQDCGLNYTKNV